MWVVLCLVNNFWQTFQPIFVILVLDVATIQNLVEVHNKHIEG
jgi:hypothetical protein